MNINTITAYLLVSNTDAVELKQQLRSFDASEDMCKVISLLSEEWYVHKRLNNLFDYALRTNAFTISRISGTANALIYI